MDTKQTPMCGRNRAADLGEVFNELLIEIGELNKALYIFEILWSVPVYDCLDLLKVYIDLSFMNKKLEAFDLRVFKLAFLQIEIEIILSKAFKYFMNDFAVRGSVGGPDKNAIKIDCKFTFSDEISKDVIHQSLKCS